MAVQTSALLHEAIAIVYPSSDGKPMADNTLQFEWIMTVKGGLDVLFANDPNVFVAGDLLWYPFEGDNTTCIAPDALVAFGRPKGYRASYLQWREGGIAPQVVFEILSPGNSRREMQEKLERYDRYGVEEFYVYNPYKFIVEGWLRAAGKDRIRPIKLMEGWVSPRLGVQFRMRKGEPLKIYRPDGRRFLTFLELEAKGDFAELERQRAEQRAGQAEHRAGQAELDLDRERQRADRFAALLRASGIDPNSAA